MKEEKTNKPFYKKIWFWIVIIIFIIAFGGDSQNTIQNGIQDGMKNVIEKNETYNNIQTSENKIKNEIVKEVISSENKVNSTQLATEFEWTNQGSDKELSTYIVLVGNNSYNDGKDYERIEAGTYLVKHTNNRNIFDISTERIYNIFITKEFIPLNEFEYEKINYIEASLGGFNGLEAQIEAEDGEYIYIQNLKDGKNGHLKFTKK